MTEDKPVFPITISWVEDGEIEIFKDLKEMECSLEWFNTDNPQQGATVTDKFGRRVHLRIEGLKTLDFAIADAPDA